jgi:nucleoid-associated protein YgaU
MRIKRNPKLLATVLAIGTAALIGGGVLTASWPAAEHQSRADAAVVASSAGSGSPHQQVSPSLPSAVKPVGGSSAKSTTHVAPPPTDAQPRTAAKAPTSFTYTVKSGDTLSGIAAWFKLHGYGDLYSANAAVLGSDPNLIRPGERITVTGGVWTMQGPA